MWKINVMKCLCMSIIHHSMVGNKVTSYMHGEKRRDWSHISRKLAEEKNNSIVEFYYNCIAIKFIYKTLSCDRSQRVVQLYKAAFLKLTMVKVLIFFLWLSQAPPSLTMWDLTQFLWDLMQFSLRLKLKWGAVAYVCMNGIAVCMVWDWTGCIDLLCMGFRFSMNFQLICAGLISQVAAHQQ